MENHEQRAAAGALYAAAYYSHRVYARQDAGLRQPPFLPSEPTEPPDPTLCPRPHRAIFRRMADRFQEATKAAGIALTQHGYFSVNAAQIKTLERCGVSPEAIQLVNLVNGLAAPAGYYHLYDRTRLLASLPPAPDNPDEPVDWEAWWLQFEASLNGIRSFTHPEKDDTISPAIDRDILPAIRAAAVRNAPLPERIIALVARSPKPQVSQYYIAVNSVRNLARGILADPGDLPNYDRTPESVAAGIRRHLGNGNEPADIRSLPGPENWTQDGYDPSHERIHAREGVIISVNAAYHHFSMLSAAAYGHGDVPGPSYLPPDEPNDITEPEAFYAELVAPSWHATPQTWQQPDLPTAVAQRYGLTPQQVRDPGSPPAKPPSPCGLANECPTWCGSLQRQGWRASPLTEDGRPDSCEFYQFHRQHRDAPPDARAALAEAKVRRIQDRKKPAREPRNAEQTDVEEAEAQLDNHKQHSLF